MPFVFLIVGLMLIVIGARNQQGNAVTLLKSEFTGANSFVEWLVVALIIGGLGYIPKVKPVSDAFLFLMILVMIIANQEEGGLFAQFENAVKNTQATPSPSTTSQTSTTSTPTSSVATNTFNVPQATQYLTTPGNLFGSQTTFGGSGLFSSSSGGGLFGGSFDGFQPLGSTVSAGDDNYDT